MERQQHQQWARQPKSPLLGRSRQPLRTSKAAFSFGKPGWALSLVVLGSAWVVVLVIAMMAVSGLLNPSASKGNRTPEAAIIRRETAETARASTQARMPLWLFGAIALSCAAGSMLVAKQANRPPRPRHTKVKRLTPYAPAPPTELPPLPSPPPLPAPPSLPTLHHPPAVPSFILNSRQAQHPSTVAMPSTAPPTLMQLAHQDAQFVEQPTDVSVTVVPREDKHPLDWSEASRIDRLTNRKQRSISSLL